MISTQVEEAQAFCNKVKKCGHQCKGVHEEKKCLPCLHPDCVTGNLPDETELCGICYTSELGEEPCARLSCGHVFHANCIAQLLQHGYPTLRISFGFMSCPACKAQIDVFDCEPIAKELRPLIKMKAQVERMALQNAEAEGIFKDGRINTPGDFYEGKPLEYALHRCSFYQCHSCKKPYFGGLIDCEQEQAQEAEQKRSKEDLTCKDCLLKEIGAGQTTCEKHGNVQIDWKCMYCCSTALFCCFGTHYMCEPCHSSYNWGIMPLKDCHGVNCPLGIAHPPPHNDPKKGGVFPLGCGICRSEKLEKLQQLKDANQLLDLQEDKPKAWIYNNQAQIIRPKIEIEVPEFIWNADELQAQIDAENERLRVEEE